jgi:DNA-binding NtrC family response regulator
VVELPLSTQVRLLRVLESGEYIRVGSSAVQKTDVRIIAATNVDIVKATQENKFREDLYYRLNTVPITVPALRERKEDIHLLFRKFASDFAETNRMPPITLTDSARSMLTNYRWPGNIRQLKNITEQISIIESEREIDDENLGKYLPDYQSVKLPALYARPVNEQTFNSEREILYKVLFDMKSDMHDLKQLVGELMEKVGVDSDIHENNKGIIKKLYQSQDIHDPHSPIKINPADGGNIQDTEEVLEESLSLEDKEIELIRKALGKHNGKRKHAAEELGISERTLYRKIKEHDIEL